MNSEFGILNSEFPFASAWNAEGGWVKFRTRRRLLRRIKSHLKEETMSRPQATLRRVGRRPTANPKSEIRNAIGR